MAETTQERWTLDGEPVELAEFLSDNRETLSIEDALRFATMVPGDEVLLGGGAFAERALRRVS